MSTEPWKTKFIKILRWSEKYTKADMVYVTKGGFWLTLHRVISSVSAFLLAIAFANLLPKETYGTYKYILSIVGILAIPTLSGMNTAVVQAVARGFDGSFKLALKTKLRWGLIGGAASLLIAGYYWFNGNATLTISFLIAGVFLPFMESFGFYDALLRGKKHFDVSSKYNIATKIIAFLVMIAVIYYTKDLVLIILSYFASYTLLRLIFLKITLKRYQPNTQRDASSISYGKHLSLIQVFNTIAAYLDRILVFQFLGAAPLAIYSIAIAGPEQIKVLLNPLQNLLFPRFAQENNERIRHGIKDKFIRLSIVSALIVVVYILVAPWLFRTFFPEYIDSILLSQIFVISMLAFGLFPAATYLKAKKKLKEIYISNIISAFFQIAIMTIMIIWQGLLGLVIARILSRYFRALLNLFFYYKVNRD